MTTITNFDSLELGKESPAILFVENIKFGEGLIVHYHKFYRELHRIELRKKDNDYIFVVYNFTDAELPDYWKDSEILWSELVIPQEYRDRYGLE